MERDDPHDRAEVSEIPLPPPDGGGQAAPSVAGDGRSEPSSIGVSRSYPMRVLTAVTMMAIVVAVVALSPAIIVFRTVRHVRRRLRARRP